MEKRKMARPYLEIMEDVKKAPYGKPCRRLHKELKEYKDGLPMFMRYPNAPIIMSIIAGIVTFIAAIFPIIALLVKL